MNAQAIPGTPTEALVAQVRAVLRAIHGLNLTISLDWLAARLDVDLDSMTAVEFTSFANICDAVLEEEGWRDIPRKRRT